MRTDLRRILTRLAGWLAAAGLAAGILSAAACPAYADASPDMADGTRRVFDEAHLFTAEETERLEEEAKALRDQMKADVVLVTAEDAGGRDSQNYADDFYDQGGFGTHQDKSGVLFLIDMENRQISVSTSGVMIRFLTDDRIETMMDHAYEYASQGDYGGVMDQFLSDTARYYKKGIPGGQYNYDTETGQISRHRSIRWYEALLALGVPLFSAAGACANVKREYAMKKERGRAASYNMAYRANAQFTFQDLNDLMVNSYVTQQIIPLSSGRGGGGGMGGFGGGGGGMSSTHTSSGGSTHGGGSRGF